MERVALNARPTGLPAMMGVTRQANLGPAQAVAPVLPTSRTRK